MIALIHLDYFNNSRSTNVKLLSDASEIDDPKILFMSSKEAESLNFFKLLSCNESCIFNELDSFSWKRFKHKKYY